MTCSRERADVTRNEVNTTRERDGGADVAINAVRERDNGRGGQRSSVRTAECDQSHTESLQGGHIDCCIATKVDGQKVAGFHEGKSTKACVDDQYLDTVASNARDGRRVNDVANCAHTGVCGSVHVRELSSGAEELNESQASVRLQSTDVAGIAAKVDGDVVADFSDDQTAHTCVDYIHLNEVSGRTCSKSAVVDVVHSRERCGLHRWSDR